MSTLDSALDSKAVARARRLLRTPQGPRERERLWPALGAAFLFAVSAVSFAVAMVLAPPLITEHTVRKT